jgi:CO dehydrogenase/acetyl-CoA synthase beta subunit
MELFAETIDKIRTFVHKKDPLRSWVADGIKEWPAGGKRNIVLGDDVGVELGNPKQESLSCIIWTEHCERINDNAITVIGPDIPDAEGKSLPFGKIVLLCVKDFDEENTYERYREIEAIRYGLDLKGYMLRAAPQYQKEWCRISKEAVANGFSFDVLGNSLMKKFREKDYVQAVELIFITSSTEDVAELSKATNKVIKIIGAMNKMASEIETECESCEYQETCADVEGLKAMRAALQKSRGEGK